MPPISFFTVLFVHCVKRGPLKVVFFAFRDCEGRLIRDRLERCFVKLLKYNIFSFLVSYIETAIMAHHCHFTPIFVVSLEFSIPISSLRCLFTSREASLIWENEPLCTVGDALIVLIGSVTASFMTHARLNVTMFGPFERVAFTVREGFFIDFWLFANKFKFVRNINIIFLLKLCSE